MAHFIEKTTHGMDMFINDDDDKELRVHYRQDFEPYLNWSKMLRNDGLTDKGIKNEMWLYASIPPIVIMDLRYRFGIDVFNKDHQKKLLEVINKDYPYLKCTEKVHAVKH